ncbi:ABC transporter permease [Aliarcobacter skirrowii]|jgi:peptide/nickel transport system permease protein|uniref:ABC transporter permease n=1 Tax=Aliarcobacter skirrowii CCUG 10374 TaxID=1032239 RepID=A0AAD0WMP3_9BACT|nr:ABC transporter permease [Aliarcobacter skirrowii]AXX84058.1 dipeptide/oligopeptide/nickel ABC transporter, permease protein [Aliarcobacter skirrowii CCUG 10374]KAB0621754.1 ABC transporter permease [Aliarcobacter skirrowii CCUG 10374]MDY0180108.1 ABC transporter permease [Aliarcobacter skirrowii]RXI27007.1 ABC transporter permease [Aliarcobacter skirrowii CCUG 10374]SUU95449.1 Nickel transport system permease protein nikB [Aliarcobacter skirrowii]
MNLFLKKLLYIIIMLFIISLISFIAINLAPNSFFASGELNPNITPEAIEELKKIYGLDKPLYIQFFSWVYSILQLDFGISFSSGSTVKDEILSRIPITLTINIISMILVFLISLYLGIKAAMKKESIFDRFTKQLSLLSFSMPSFYLALILVLIFSIQFELFPIAGLHSVPNDGSLNYYLDFAWHLVLPIFIIVFGGIGSLILYIRALTIEILKSDYIFFAKARGLDNKKILRYYILPNLYPPVITLLGLSLPGVIGGSVILETIFSIDGMGLLFYQSALSHDYPVIMGILIIGAFLTLIGNMIADLVLLKLNPNYNEK